MTATLISLISILIGIFGANIMGYCFKKYSFGLTGNTIAGVFGSVFLIKSFGRLGFSPKFIVQVEHINYALFSLNSSVSFLGGAVAVFLIYQLKNKLGKKKY
ncbi:hypothetical protein [Tenacibaculum finnmarkense]|uniref:hypothetical protein n=1 Tax=Tenacibaculum finnmarkense TaxID=2781243 RepID=UPI00187BB5CD|nr:hypothetical protein [Tenacibaculum finnmarkense]MBE7633077.1 hypothetical protein [Tenacibaculum finnmarkense genomovar ulcerans]MBE7644732.1 hypothetical protein [Tenacibaculum finnmarkense genomovar ulcerans]MBE7646898.1 hypothetical protein [Tenacibaculum finnmarkense genomovar ulcerans]MBE7686674.1 hypothetical protein [Tenacibaculum finnmarkense genomovar ulcerans]MCD8399023.1 hypothetical protein [Tenacibaculum finnmarkense genomovar ulcerans]